MFNVIAVDEYKSEFHYYIITNKKDSSIEKSCIVHKIKRRMVAKYRRFILEGQEGLEPSTFCLRGRRSNQLSYWPKKLSWKIL